MARLLPVAIVAMTALAAVKAVALVQAATPVARADVPSAVAPPALPPALPPGTAMPAPAIPAPAIPAPAIPAPAIPAPAAAPEPAISDGERALLLDLRRRRAGLDTREAALAGRESLLAAGQARLALRMSDLDALRQRLEQLEQARRGRDEAGWQGLVRTYETMKPKEAAAIFNELEMPVLLQVMDRMRDGKAAPVLAAMLPDRARMLTSELVKLRTRANAEPRANPKTGGP